MIDNKIIDIDLSVTQKKKFRIDNDDNRIVELNTSDVGIVSRISRILPELEKLQKEAVDCMASMPDVNEDTPISDVQDFGAKLDELDKKMRQLVDEIFDADVCSKAAPSGSMYDPFNGSCRYEHILNVFIAQYEDNLTAEYDKITKQIKKHTDKYTKK